MQLPFSWDFFFPQNFFARCYPIPLSITAIMLIAGQIFVSLSKSFRNEWERRIKRDKCPVTPAWFVLVAWSGNELLDFKVQKGISERARACQTPQPYGLEKPDRFLLWFNSLWHSRVYTSFMMYFNLFSKSYSTNGASYYERIECLVRVTIPLFSPFDEFCRVKLLLLKSLLKKKAKKDIFRCKNNPDNLCNFSPWCFDRYREDPRKPLENKYKRRLWR